MTTVLAGLDDVDWASLSHAYRDASDVPSMIRGLLDPDRVDESTSDLAASILHQGTIYSATAPATDFIAEVAADPSAPGRDAALFLLTYLAESISPLPEHPDDTYVDQDADARAALMRAVETVAPGLDEDDPDWRGAVGVLLAHVRPLPATAIQALQTQWAGETDSEVKAVLVVSLAAHGGLPETAPGQLAQLPDNIRFAAAWSELQAGHPITNQIDTLATRWNQCVEELENSRVAEDLNQVQDAAACLSGRPDLVPFWARLAQTGGRGLGDAVRVLQELGTRRRDNFPDVAQTLLDIAEQADGLPGVDSPLLSWFDNALTARQFLVYALVNFEPGVKDSESDRLVKTLRHLVTSSPDPSYIVFEKQHCDIRADAIPALIRRPGWQELLRDVLARREQISCQRWEPSSFGGGMDILGTLARIPDLSETTQQELMAFAAEQLSQTVDCPTAIEWVEVLDHCSAIPPTFVQTTILEAIRALPHTFIQPDSYSNPGEEKGSYIVKVIAPVLLRWRTPGIIGLLTEWANDDWDQAAWAQLALGILTEDPVMIDHAFAQGIPTSEFLSLAASQHSPALLTVCRDLMTGKAEISFPGRADQIQAITILSDSGLETVWPTLIAVLLAQGFPLAGAARTALTLLERHPDPDRRSELVQALRQITTSEPNKALFAKDYESLVWAVGALLDLGEPMPDLAVTHSLALIQKLSRYSDYESWKAFDEACRVLTASLPELPIDKKNHAIETLSDLIDSHYRIGYQSDIRKDITFTTKLRELLSTIEQSQQ